MLRPLPALALFFIACGPATKVENPLPDAGIPSTPKPDSGTQPQQPQSGCPSIGCYTVYAHTDHVLYLVDLKTKSLVQVGPFRSDGDEVITDLAVTTTDVLYAVSNTSLYTVNTQDGHVTKVGPLSACGEKTVALTFTPDDRLYAADYNGTICQIEPSTGDVTPIGELGGGLIIEGDLVAVADGTMFGTASRKSEPASRNNNLLVEIDPKTGKARKTLGKTGFGKMFGTAYALGEVFGFTHDGSGAVVTINPKNGEGTLYATFKNPDTGQGISFAGAAVNAMVPVVFQ